MDFTVNRVHFFNFATFKDKYVASQPLRARIGEYCALYVDENSKPLESPTLAVIDSDYSFNPLSVAHLKDLERYALALLFCSIGGKPETTVCGSDQFTLHISEAG